LAGLDEGGKMHYAIKTPLTESLFDLRPVGQISFDETGIGCDGLPSAMAEVVVDGNFMPGSE
jgi:hypothetical protein